MTTKKFKIIFEVEYELSIGSIKNAKSVISRMKKENRLPFGLCSSEHGGFDLNFKKVIGGKLAND